MGAVNREVIADLVNPVFNPDKQREYTLFFVCVCVFWRDRQNKTN